MVCKGCGLMGVAMASVELSASLTGVRLGHALEHFGDVAQVEQVVRLGWGREQILSDRVVHIHCRCHHRRRLALDTALE